MALEESVSRAFYHWELLENLRERRAMQKEEGDMKEMIREEKRLEKDQVNHFIMPFYHFSLPKQLLLLKLFFSS